MPWEEKEEELVIEAFFDGCRTSNRISIFGFFFPPLFFGDEKEREGGRGGGRGYQHTAGLCLVCDRGGHVRLSVCLSFCLSVCLCSLFFFFLFLVVWVTDTHTAQYTGRAPEPPPARLRGAA